MNGGQLQLPKTRTSGLDDLWKSLMRRLVTPSETVTTSASCAGPPCRAVFSVSSIPLRSTLRTCGHVNSVSCIVNQHALRFTASCVIIVIVVSISFDAASPQSMRNLLRFATFSLSQSGTGVWSFGHGERGSASL